MSVTEVNSILYLHLTGSAGNITINNEIPVQRMVIQQYAITWTTSAASQTVGGAIMFDIQPFTSSVINSNVLGFGSIPLLNDSSSLATVQTVAIPLDMDRSFQQAFTYRIVTPQGDPPADLVSLDLIISYASGSQYQ